MTARHHPYIERPCLYSTPMVRGLLADDKIRTRRILTGHHTQFGSAPADYWRHADFSKAWGDGKELWQNYTWHYLHVPCHREEDDISCARCVEMGWEGTTHRLWLRYSPTSPLPPTRFWVRETFAFLGTNQRGPVLYRADTRDADLFPGEQVRVDAPWRPSIHMPRSAARIFLDVTDGLIEHVQDITEAEAWAEGVQWFSDPINGRADITLDRFGSAREAFRVLWSELHGPDSWDANPWVVVYRFLRVSAHA